MVDDMAELRLKILWVKEAMNAARSDTARGYAAALLRELEGYLSVLETTRAVPVTTAPPK